MSLLKFYVFTFLSLGYCLNIHAQDLKTYSSNTIDSIYKYYSADDNPLFREHYPFDATYRADYLGTDANATNKYSYLWPFSGALSAQVTRYELEKSPAIRKDIDTHILKGLALYYDTRKPQGYASYINTAPQSDRFYDDNVWLGIDFVDLYLLTSNQLYLDKAQEIWTFIESGTDDKLGGGIYWCEQRKESKNTCSNAPGSVLALKLYQATNDEKYFEQGKALYNWTKINLQDKQDHLYFDNINLTGHIDSAKYSYNSGQMIQAAALLYKITNEETFFKDAEAIAVSSYSYFFKVYEDTSFPRLKNGNLWFHAVMLRGFAELYDITKDGKYLDTFRQNMEFAWNNMRDPNGLFGTDWGGNQSKGKKWLLDQFAMVEMFARLATRKH